MDRDFRPREPQKKGDPKAAPDFSDKLLNNQMPRRHDGEFRLLLLLNQRNDNVTLHKLMQCASVNVSVLLLISLDR